MKLERTKFTNTWNSRIPNRDYRIFEHKYWERTRYSIQVIFWIERALFEKQIQVRWIKTLEYAMKLAEEIEKPSYMVKIDLNNFYNADQLRW